MPARIYKGGESVKGLGAAAEPTTTGDQHSRAERGRRRPVLARRPRPDRACDERELRSGTFSLGPLPGWRTPLHRRRRRTFRDPSHQAAQKVCTE
jgi:hypothetical protein